MAHCLSLSVPLCRWTAPGFVAGSCLACHEALSFHSYSTNIFRAVPYDVAQCSYVAYGYIMGHYRPHNDCFMALALRRKL